MLIIIFLLKYSLLSTVLSFSTSISIYSTAINKDPLKYKRVIKTKSKC